MGSSGSQFSTRGLPASMIVPRFRPPDEEEHGDDRSCPSPAREDQLRAGTHAAEERELGIRSRSPPARCQATPIVRRSRTCRGCRRSGWPSLIYGLRPGAGAERNDRNGQHCRDDRHCRRQPEINFLHASRGEVFLEHELQAVRQRLKHRHRVSSGPRIGIYFANGGAVRLGPTRF